ncbi:response regulator [Vallitalea guaymasensis]|uniref:Stage 0 sporulation protein A homolog n=1 Tax=Vallitalea guaymasensis TaxID=1185412 RepID=A0A8J8M8N8_9FIRM|nr:response regulator transcription factor [Vallitalea guaymasensis]QUH28442.1 response regulator transcription factor [Vallitalea guaymasensis]
MIKVIIADDQSLLRKSLSQIISIDEKINVIGQAANGKEAIELCKLHHPDIVLMDIEMPEMDGISALKIIKKNYKNTKVIILTTFENTDNIVESFLSQADGYITKDIDPDELITTIKCVGYGLTVIHKSVKNIMVDKFRKMGEGRKKYADILSMEQIDMIKLIVDGKSNKEIAKIFNYTEGTIKNKVSRIYEKLGISDRLQLAVYAVENGIE